MKFDDLVRRVLNEQPQLRLISYVYHAADDDYYDISDPNQQMSIVVNEPVSSTSLVEVAYHVDVWDGYEHRNTEVFDNSIQACKRYDEILKQLHVHVVTDSHPHVMNILSKNLNLKLDNNFNNWRVIYSDGKGHMDPFALVGVEINQDMYKPSSHASEELLGF
jgi:hypothetical protein